MSSSSLLSVAAPVVSSTSAGPYFPKAFFTPGKLKEKCRYQEPPQTSIQSLPAYQCPYKSIYNEKLVLNRVKIQFCYLKSEPRESQPQHSWHASWVICEYGICCSSELVWSCPTTYMDKKSFLIGILYLHYILSRRNYQLHVRASLELLSLV